MLMFRRIRVMVERWQEGKRDSLRLDWMRAADVLVKCDRTGGGGYLHRKGESLRDLLDLAMKREKRENR